MDVTRFLPLGLLCAFTCIVFVALGAITALAGTTGGIQGFVTDMSLHPLAGVNVSAVAPWGRGATTTAVNGFYSLNGLPLDTYAVAFSKEG